MCPVPQVSPSPSWEPQSIWVPRRDRKGPLVPLWNVPSQSLQDSIEEKGPHCHPEPQRSGAWYLLASLPKATPSLASLSPQPEWEGANPAKFHDSGSNCDGTGDTADWRPVQRPLSGEGHGGSERCWGHEGHCAKSEEPLEKVQPQKLGDRVTGMDSQLWQAQLKSQG